jgi:hypothetical protein
MPKVQAEADYRTKQEAGNALKCGRPQEARGGSICHKSFRSETGVPAFRDDRVEDCPE